LAAASGHALQGRVVGQDGVLKISPMPTATAREVLDHLLSIWLQGQQSPLPLPLKTALVMAAGGVTDDPVAQQKILQEAEKVYAGDDAYGDNLAEVRDMCLARVFPDFETLLQTQTPGLQNLQSLALQVYGPLREWATQCVTAVAYAKDAQAQNQGVSAHD
jgi:exodeoxyribonuclease V gamma subunit